MGMLPSVASRQDAWSSSRWSFGEYAPHSEKFSTFRASVTPRTITQDRGATRVYLVHTVALE